MQLIHKLSELFSLFSYTPKCWVLRIDLGIDSDVLIKLTVQNTK